MQFTYTYVNYTAGSKKKKIKFLFVYFAVNQVAKESVWFIGDNFLWANFQAYNSIYEQAKRSDKFQKPYVHDYYNTELFYRKSKPDDGGPPARIINSLDDAITETPFLPRIIVVITDIDAL